MRRLAHALPAALLATLTVAGGLALAPAGAGGDPPATASFTATDDSWNVSGTATNQTTLAPGGTVSFAYPTGVTAHNVDFGSGPAPSSCSQSAGPSSGAVPPLPATPTGQGWSGRCTFNTPGTYTFHCHLHQFMTGTIVVGTATSTTTSTSSASTTTSSTAVSSTSTAPTSTTSASTVASSTSAPATTSSSTTSSTGSGPASAPPPRLTVPTRQRGSAIKASFRLPRGSRWRIHAALLAVPGRGVLHIPSGSLGAVNRSAGGGSLVRLAVPLDRTGLTALRRSGRLLIRLTITLQLPSGRPLHTGGLVLLSFVAPGGKGH